MSKAKWVGGNKGKVGFIFSVFGPGSQNAIKRSIKKIIMYGIGTGLMLGAGKKYGKRLLPFVRGKGRKYLNYAGRDVSQLYDYFVKRKKRNG
ncbi:MAG TPA: hypothetical protein GX516_05410 [Thermoanaerobacter sp.]|uniref:hypothetical protein n=1 Tax=Thermoanaerobacter sp. A7A TaxID=1350366 RepID=UPI0003F8517F|nr:hypothetical protein [Thermoanaerobacter sp. A7A]HHY79784.1 hypothetical protein [Thermoanaerobacter sp.]